MGRRKVAEEVEEVEKVEEEEEEEEEEERPVISKAQKRKLYDRALSIDAKIRELEAQKPEAAKTIFDACGNAKVSVDGQVVQACKRGETYYLRYGNSEVEAI
jgi:regulator of protease activity HflC (stomatin/prohibitin superfamily)